MSNTKHTPGPWMVDRPGTLFHIRTMDEINGTVATCDPCDFATQEQLANARLIAAAPELLEALRELVESVAISDPGVYDLDAARAAIAKATGQ
jgi:hypothetical protein